MDEHFKPLLDPLLMALESLQQILANKEDPKGGEETAYFNASYGSRDLQNYETTLSKNWIRSSMFEEEKLENLNTTEYNRLLLYLSNTNHKQAIYQV